MRAKKIIPLIFLIIILLDGCGSRVPETHYYLIDYPLDPKSQQIEPAHHKTIGVERFRAMPLYNDERLVYRDSPYEGKYYNYHRWITTPERMITNKMIEQLNSSNLFDQVVAFPRFSNVDYILRGTIKTLEEWDENNAWYARVRLEFNLVETTGYDLVWQKTIEKKNKVIKKTPAEVVKGINSCVQQCIEEAEQELDALFSRLK